MQRRRVLAATDDRVVADVVAHGAGATEERALEPALAVAQHVVPVGDRVLEAQRRGVAGGLQLPDLPGVLDQPQLGGHPGQVAVGGQVAGLGRGAGQSGLELVDVTHLQTQGVGDLLQRRAASGPELAVLPVAEELVGLAGGARPGVEHALAVLDHEHGVGGEVAGEVGVRGVGAEAVVGVVGAHLVGAGRQHQALAGEGGGEPLATGRGEVCDRVARQVELAVAPAGAHEGGVGLRHRRVVRLGPGLGLRLLAHAATVRRRARQG